MQNMAGYMWHMYVNAYYIVDGKDILVRRLVAVEKIDRYVLQFSYTNVCSSGDTATAYSTVCTPVDDY
jgi:hypothetical protein